MRPDGLEDRFAVELPDVVLAQSDRRQTFGDRVESNLEGDHRRVRLEARSRRAHLAYDPEQGWARCEGASQNLLPEVKRFFDRAPWSRRHGQLLIANRRVHIDAVLVAHGLEVRIEHLAIRDEEARLAGPEAVAKVRDGEPQAPLVAAVKGREVAVEWDERPADALAHYNLACSYALLKRPEQSLKTLRRAVELGYRDFRYMREDHDLDSIRHDPRFRQLLRECEKL